MTGGDDNNEPTRQWVGYECGKKIWDTGFDSAPTFCPECGADAVRRQSGEPGGATACTRTP